MRWRTEAPACRTRKKSAFSGAQGGDDARHYGLGLAVAAELTALHGGRLWVQDTPGGGATFCLELPRADDPGDMEPGRGLDKKSPH